MVTYFWKNYPWAWAWVLSRRRHVTDEAKSDRTPGGGDDSTELRRQVWRPSWT